MFDRNDIEAYQSIMVPSELRGRIERDAAQKQTKPRIIGGSGLRRLALPMAACLILLCTVLLNLPLGGDASVLAYNGAPVTQTRMALGNENGRTTPAPLSGDEVLSLILSIEEKGEYTVSVNSGVISTPDGEEILANEGVEKELKGKRDLLWTPDITNGEIPVLSILMDGEIMEFALEYDESAGDYVIYKR